MTRRIAVLGLILFLGSGWVCAACTVFSYAGDGVLLFGNSEDYDRLTPHIWFLNPTPFALLTNRESSAFSTRVSYGWARCPKSYNSDSACVTLLPFALLTNRESSAFSMQLRAVERLSCRSPISM